MTCEECELKLGMGDDAREHLAGCAECRGLARELGLNARALRQMRAGPVWASAPVFALAAAAALVVMAIFPREEKLSLPAVRGLVAPDYVQVQLKKKAAHGAAPHRRHQQEQALRVKMFTSDPDVVIYWIVDRKEGFE